MQPPGCSNGWDRRRVIGRGFPSGTWALGKMYRTGWSGFGTKLIITIVVTPLLLLPLPVVSANCALLFIVSHRYDLIFVVFFFRKMTLSHGESIVIRFSQFSWGGIWHRHHSQGLAH